MPDQDPLAQLRDIQLPDPISAWPPAPGWWLLLMLVIIAAATASYFYLRHRKRNAYRGKALRQLASINASCQNQSGNIYLQAINQLLKQTAMAAYGSDTIAAMHGQQWLAFLDSSASCKGFSEGPGEILLEGPYSASDEAVPTAALNTLIEQWIRGHKLPC